MCFPELAQSPFADDSHSAIPFNGYTRILRALGQAWARTDLKARRSRSKPFYRLRASEAVAMARAAFIAAPKFERAAGNRMDRSPAGTPATGRASDSYATFFDRRQGGTMPDIDRAEKLVVALGQRIKCEQNEILRMIATSLRGVESHLPQIAVSSNPLLITYDWLGRAREHAAKSTTTPKR
jgi:hypothetical protein